MKYLGIDWGQKRIGLAIGHSEPVIAIPFCVVGDLDEVVKIIKNKCIDIVIIGEPRTMQNKELQMKNRVDKFITNLKNKINIEVIMIDERLTSKNADNLLGDKKSKAPRDAIAAMLILQMYFDKFIVCGH